MPVTRPPTRFLVNGKCHDGCSVGPARTGEQPYRLIHADIEAGWADLSVAERANARGIAISHGSVNRHRKLHLTFVDSAPDKPEYQDLTELEALDAAIRKGQEGIPNWKMTPSEWMKALELKLRLTEGTVFDGFMRAVASASQEVADDDAASDGLRPPDVGDATDAA